MRETHGGGRRYKAHAHEITRARIYVDHETRVPAYSSTPTRDTRACVFVYTHTSRVGVNEYAVFLLRNMCPTARTGPHMLSKTSPRASIQAARSRAHLHGAAAPARTYSVCPFQSHLRVLRADRAGVDGAAASPGRGQEREAGGGRVAGALRPGADAAAEEAPVRTRAGRAGWMTRV
jgi:hypothetical protein